MQKETFSQQVIQGLFPKRHSYNGSLRPLIRSSITLEKTRRDRRRPVTSREP
jgi:hypothetical protein